MKQKIAIVGPESTGKSELSAWLATQLNTRWVPEFARNYLEQLEGPYERKDLLQIAKGQKALETQLLREVDQFLICDTNLLVIKVWSEFKYGQCDPWILRHMDLQSYAMHLLTDIDLPWQEDPLREHPHRREELMQIYLDELSHAGVPFAKITGTGLARFHQAWEAIQPLTRSA